MDNRLGGQPSHHHSNPDLPRHWIVLPPSVVFGTRSDPVLSRLLPTHVGYFPNAKRHYMARPNGAAQTIFKYCIDGRGYCDFAGRHVVVGPGDLLVVPARCPHTYGADPDRPWSIHWFHVIGAQLPGILAELGVDCDNPVVAIGKDPRLLSLFEELRDVLEHDYAHPSLLYASRLLSHLVGLLIRLHRQPRGRAVDASQRVLESVARLKSELQHPLDVRSLAAAADLCPSHYCTLFRRLVGESPARHLNRLRLHQAAQLLATTDSSIGHIARSLGYGDPLYFSRAFRRVNGVSPSEYRRDSPVAQDD